MTKATLTPPILLFAALLILPAGALAEPVQVSQALPPVLGAPEPPSLAISGSTEMGLAGVRLEQDVLELLDKLGQPGFIGPTGAVVGKAAGEPFNAPVTPGGLPGGRTATTVSPTGSMLRLTLSSSRDSGSQRSGPRGAPVGAVPQGSEAPHYWLWFRGGYQLAVALTPKGIVTSIMVAGKFPNPTVKTEKGITLADSYDKIVKAYGFPESTENRGGLLIVRYPSSGVTFTLEKQRVIGICLEAHPGPSSGMVMPATVATGPMTLGQPGALGIRSGGRLGGLSLRGRGKD